MKRILTAFVALFAFIVTASGMSYEQARRQALFLTDKMAYELNLTEEQYEAAYEINLDYLMSVNTADDLYGTYWAHRNQDLCYILLDWQYRSFVAASYFYRPLWWDAGYWHFGIYARYPHRDYFYFGRPRFYAHYRGGHSWRMNGGRSWYRERNFYGRRNDSARFGMRDRFHRGDYRNGFDGRPTRFAQNDRTRSFGNHPTRSFGGNRTGIPRESSTRTTVSRGQRPFGNGAGAPGRSRNFNDTQQYSPSRSFTPSGGNRTYSTPNRSFGTSRSSFRTNRSFSSPSRSFGGSTRSFRGNRNGSFGGHR